jgi:sugar lactone lactonase YvrE
MILPTLPNGVPVLWSLVAVLTAGAQSNYEPYAFTTVAGVPNHGGADGTGSDARFFDPLGVAVDGAGNVYVADFHNDTLRKVTPGGVVSTLAGLAGSYGSNDGKGAVARFGNAHGGLIGAAADNLGNVYVSDYYNCTIRKVTAAGVVTTVAGLAGSFGGTDGTGSAARFTGPRGVALDRAGNLYVADAYNHTIRKITPQGVVTTVAGLAGTHGNTDGVGSVARFYYPSGVALDGGGSLYVTDTANHTIRKLSPSGTATWVVTTFAGLAGVSGGTDGTGSDARFDDPQGIAVDASGVIYVSEVNTDRLRKISPDGVVTKMAGLTDIPGSVDGPLAVARFSHPIGLAVDAGHNLYVADSGNNTIRKIAASGAVSTVAGQPGVATDGRNTSARFNHPAAVALDPRGNLYVADYQNNTIRKVNSAGVVTTLAGTPGVSGTNDGVGNAALFGGPTGIAVDREGDLIVADYPSHTIRKVSPVGANWVVTTLAGLAGIFGSTDGTRGAARFDQPQSVAVDRWDNIYVSDSGNHTIRQVTLDGQVITVAGLAGVSGSDDGSGSSARFNRPFGVAADVAGNLFVADYNNDTIRQLSRVGTLWSVTTLAGQAGKAGYADGVGGAATFYEPHGLAVDLAGNVFVVDSGNQLIRKVTPAGGVSTLAGQPGIPESADGVGGAVRFFAEDGIAVDSAGSLYVADTGNNTIRRGFASVSMPMIATGSTWADGHQFGFYVTGPAGQSVVVDTTADLVQWQPKQTNLLNGILQFSEPQPVGVKPRFYRVRPQSNP